ncbi:unnamed protein product, partial [Dovyalis caffra]
MAARPLGNDDQIGGISDYGYFEGDGNSHHSFCLYPRKGEEGRACLKTWVSASLT